MSITPQDFDSTEEIDLYEALNASYLYLLSGGEAARQFVYSRKDKFYYDLLISFATVMIGVSFLGSVASSSYMLLALLALLTVLVSFFVFLFQKEERYVFTDEALIWWHGDEVKAVVPWEDVRGVSRFGVSLIPHDPHTSVTHLNVSLWQAKKLRKMVREKLSEE